jgi:hypothetical protein
LSRLCGKSPAPDRPLQKIADGTREVTDDVHRKVAGDLFKESARMYEAAAKIELMVGKMLAEFEE